jgi:hypothetical protein
LINEKQFFFNAVKKNDLPLVKSLLKNNKFDIYSINSAMQYSAENGFSNILKFLLKDPIVNRLIITDQT